MSVDPIGRLRLSDAATADEVRAARKDLAQRHHPHHGCDAASMRRVNEAADAALAHISTRRPEPSSGEFRRDPSTARLTADERIGGRVTSDMPSFTVEALPVETFEGLLVVASWIGEVLDDDPPYRLEVHLREPTECWCRLEVVPDAGASTVSLTIAGLDDAPPPDIVDVRDLWVDQLNRVDWA